MYEQYEAGSFSDNFSDNTWQMYALKFVLKKYMTTSFF